MRGSPVTGPWKIPSWGFSKTASKMRVAARPVFRCRGPNHPDETCGLITGLSDFLPITRRLFGYFYRRCFGGRRCGFRARLSRSGVDFRVGSRLRGPLLAGRRGYLSGYARGYQLYPVIDRAPVQLFRSSPFAELSLEAGKVYRELEPITADFFVGPCLRNLFPAGDDIPGFASHERIDGSDQPMDDPVHHRG